MLSVPMGSRARLELPAVLVRPFEIDFEFRDIPCTHSCSLAATFLMCKLQLLPGFSLGPQPPAMR